MADAATTAYGIDTVLKLFTDLETNIKVATASSITNLKAPLLALTSSLAVIGIASNWEMYFSHNFNWGNIITKIIHVGFIMWLINHWTNFTLMIKDSAEKIGSLAGNLKELPTVTSLIGKSYATIFDYLDFILKDSSFGLDVFMIYLMAIILIIILSYAFLKISWTFFMAKMEFYIMGALSMVLLPFSQTKWTKSMSEKTWGILLTTSIKLLVCVFMIAITKDFIEQNFTVKAMETGLGDDQMKKAIKATLLPTLFSSTIAIFFLSHIISKVTEFAGAMANGVMIQSSNLVASAGAMVQNYATGGAKAAAGYLGRHARSAAWKGTKYTAGAAWEASKDVGSLAKTAWDNPQATGAAIKGAATFAATNPKTAGKAAISYLGSLHRAGKNLM
jgi:membrane protein